MENGKSQSAPVARKKVVSPWDLLASAMSEDEEMRAGTTGIERLRHDLDLGPSEELPSSMVRRLDP